MLEQMASILEAAAYAVFATSSVLLSAIDIRTRRLPNAIQLPTFLIIAGLLIATATVQEKPAKFFTALAVGAALFGVYYVLAWISPGALGAGDIKLAGIIGLILGNAGWAGEFWPTLTSNVVVWGTLSAWVLGGVIGVISLAATRIHTLRAGDTQRNTVRLPFAPYMFAGAWFALLTMT